MAIGLKSERSRWGVLWVRDGEAASKPTGGLEVGMNSRPRARTSFSNTSAH